MGPGMLNRLPSSVVALHLGRKQFGKGAWIGGWRPRERGARNKTGGCCLMSGRAKGCEGTGKVD